MPTYSNSGSRLIIFILLGLVLGGILGECLGLVLGQLGELASAGADYPVKNLFGAPFMLNVGMDEGVVIDLYMVKFRLGFAFKFNLCSALGMILSMYIMKWSGDR